MIKSVFKKHKENKTEYVPVFAREVNFLDFMHILDKEQFLHQFRNFFD